MERISKELGVTKEGIENFYEESVVNIMSNSFHDNSVLNGVLYNPTFNPMDKVVELYERRLKAEKEKVEYLEKLFNKK